MLGICFFTEGGESIEEPSVEGEKETEVAKSDHYTPLVHST